MLDNCPFDVSLHIISFLDLPSILTLSSLSKNLYNLCNTNEVWKFACEYTFSKGWSSKGDNWKEEFVNRKKFSDNSQQVKFIRNNLLPHYAGNTNILTINNKTVEYFQNTSYDAGSVQATRPLQRLPFGDGNLGYFEVLIENIGVRSKIGIGLSPAGYPPHAQPGWYLRSYGWHMDDYFLYGPGNNPNRYSRQAYNRHLKATNGTIVGCGRDFAKNQIFFTWNGEFLGVAFHTEPDVTELLHPTVGLHSHQEKVTVNFGNFYSFKPFLFDITSYNTVSVKTNNP